MIKSAIGRNVNLVSGNYIMRSSISVILITVLCLLVLHADGAENPNVSNSFRANSNVPSQGERRRLLSSPNPLSASGNDVVTGNVGGLRHFRGVVPYGSRYYNNAYSSSSGTSSVASFMRRSVDPILSDRNPGQTRVYYEPRRTVSSFHVQNGQRTALSESIASGRAYKSSSSLPELSRVMRSENMERPLSTNNQELEQILSRHLELQEKAKESSRKMLLESKEKFNNFFEVNLQPEEVEKSLLEQRQQDIKIEKEQEPIEKNEYDITQEAKQQLENILPGEVVIHEDLPQEEQDTKQTKTVEPDASAEDETEQEVEIHITPRDEAARILGEHKTYESLAQSKFSDYMRVAEEFMRNGQFYKAADTYSLAAIWMPQDARPYAGQAFSLFAAGEYMSSSYYLGRAIEIDPALATKKYDLAGLIGDRDVFEDRLIEMSTWQQRSGSGELAFLMAYVLYHDGKIPQAQNALEAAEKEMPDSAAVGILKEVVKPESRTNP